MFSRAQPVRRPGLTATMSHRGGCAGHRLANGCGRGGTCASRGPAPVCPQELFRHAVDGRTIANFGGGCALGRQQGPIAGLRFALLVVGPGDVDPVPTSPLRGGDHGRMEFPGVFDGGSAVAENLSDTDLVEDDAGRAEGGERMARPARRAPQPGHEDLPAAARLPDITPVPRPGHQRPGTRRAGRTREPDVTAGCGMGIGRERARPYDGRGRHSPGSFCDRRKTRRGGIPRSQRGHGGDVAAERPVTVRSLSGRAYRDWPFQNYIPVFARLAAAASGAACWQAAPECGTRRPAFSSREDERGA